MQKCENFGVSLKGEVMIIQTAPTCTNCLSRYFDNKDLSDAIIRCRGREFAVHKLILFSHSQYFAKQLNGPWKESSDKVIDIEDFDVDVVEAMVYFMYHFDYKTAEDSSALILNTKVYQIADKYGIESLKQHAASKFRDATERFWKSDDFSTAVTLAYTTTLPTDMGLRDSILETTFSNFDVIMDRDDFGGILKASPDYSYDLLRFLYKMRRGIDRYKCPKCSECFDFGNITGERFDGGPYHCPDCGVANGWWCPLPDA